MGHEVWGKLSNPADGDAVRRPQERVPALQCSRGTAPFGECGTLLAVLRLAWRGLTSLWTKRPRRGTPKAGLCLQTDLGPHAIPTQQARRCKNPRRLPEEPQCLKEKLSGLAQLPCTSPSPKSHPRKSKGNFLPNTSYRFSSTSLTVGIGHQSLLQLSAFPTKILREIFVCFGLCTASILLCICDWHLSSLKSK